MDHNNENLFDLLHSQEKHNMLIDLKIYDVLKIEDGQNKHTQKYANTKI